MSWLGRVVSGHTRSAGAIVVGAVAYAALVPFIAEPTRLIAAWDVFGVVFLGLTIQLMVASGPAIMPANARAQEEGEWTIFWVILIGAVIGFTALVGEFSGSKELPTSVRRFHISLVIVTLVLTWLVIQATFALRYAHEYYTATDGSELDRGLGFPSTENPDYWDFVYFSAVLGMTFQVSDVVITSQKLRRLATVHGLVGFVFNTVLVALTVNLAANLL